MKYIIYEMISPEHLFKVVHLGYGERQTVYRNVLEKLDVSGVESTHNSLELAMAEIQQNKSKLENKELTILPVVRITWDGEIAENF